MEITSNLEIRKLPMSVTHRIASFLDVDESILSLIMGSILKELDNPNSGPRFSSTDIEVIRKSAHQLQKSSILIFLDEWSSMSEKPGVGKLPTVHRLRTLLIKCQLFQAADYLSELMGAPEPERPRTGPAARINIALDDGIGEVLNEMGYPFSEAGNRNNLQTRPTLNSPKINFEAGTSNVNNISSPANQLPLIPFPRRDGRSTTNLIKFSTTAAPSAAEPGTSQPLMPDLSFLQNSSNSNAIPATVNSDQVNNASSAHLPAFSGLMLNGESAVNGNSDANLPALNTLINSQPKSISTSTEVSSSVSDDSSESE